MQQKKVTLSKDGAFPAILRRERTLRGWSQADVAARIGSDPKTVGRWERGRTSPSPYMCQRLSELYEKTVQELRLVGDNDETCLSKDERGTETPSPDEIGIERETAHTVVVQAVAEPLPASPSAQWRDMFRFRSEKRGKTGRSFFLSGLIVVFLLLIAMGVWWPLQRDSRLSAKAVTPIPVNPYTSRGTLALNDSLRANTAAGWSLYNNDEGQCFFADGTYRIRGIKTGGYMKLCLAAETYFNNFTYEVKMQVVAGNCGGLAFRSTFPQLYYFVICQDGNYRFVRYDRDYPQNRRIIVSGVSSAIQQGVNRTNVIAVVASGDTFTLYINRMLLYRGTDGAYLDGQIGLLAHTCRITYLDSRPDVCTVPVEVAFSEARVWRM